MRSIVKLGVSAIQVICREGWSGFWIKFRTWLRTLSTNRAIRKAERESVKLVFNSLKPISNNGAAKNEIKSADDMKCVVVSMVKNEGDIISAWLSHITAIFDAVYIADHNSTDGTREYLLEVAKSRDDVKIFSANYEGKYQKETINRLIEIAVADHPEAWVFALDADEFLASESNEHFKNLLGKMDKERVLEIRLRNCIPVRLDEDDEFLLRSQCLISNMRDPLKKVAIHSSSFLKKKWRFMEGNHSVIDFNKNDVTIDNLVEFSEIFHIPYRNIDHFVFKCLQGYLGHDLLPAGRKNPQEGFHYLRNIRTVNTLGKFNYDILRWFIMNDFRQMIITDRGINIDQMISAGWILTSLNIFYQPIPVHIYRKTKYLELAKEIVDANPGSELFTFLDVAEKVRSKSE